MTIKQHKVVSALPTPLEADSVYFVRVGSGFDVVVTNGSGTIVPYDLNAKSALASKAASGVNGDITSLTAINSILALPQGLNFNANTKIYPESNGMKIQLGSSTAASGWITIKSTGEMVLESAGLTVGGSLLPKTTTILLGNSSFPWSQAYIKTLVMSGVANLAPAVTLASAATVDLGAAAVTSNNVVITGTTTITSFGSSAIVGTERRIRFTGVLTLTQSANLLLPGAASITTAADDTATFEYQANGVWRCIQYVRAATARMGIDAGTAGSTILTKETAEAVKTYLSLDHVDNTPDAQKPVSEAVQAALALLGVDVTENEHGTSVRLACGIQFCYRYVGRVQLGGGMPEGEPTPIYQYPQPFLAGASVVRSYVGRLFDGGGSAMVGSLQEEAISSGFPAEPESYWQATATGDMGQYLAVSYLEGFAMFAVGRWKAAT